MTSRYLFLSILVATWSATTTVASAQHAHAMTEQSERPMPTDSGVTALLTGPSGPRSPNGIAVVDKQMVRIAWSGDQPGGARRWHVHEGSCSQPGPIVAVQNGYAPVLIETGGTGNGTAMLLAPLDDATTYLAAIYEDGTNTLGAMIACGSIDLHGAGARDTEERMDAGMADMAGTAGMAGMAGMKHSSASDSPSGAQPSPAETPMDHSQMGHPAAGSDSASEERSPATSPALMQLHMRMMADPVICRRVMADSAMRRMMMELVDETPPSDRVMLQGMTCASRPSPTGSSVPTPAKGTTKRPAAHTMPEAHRRPASVDARGARVPTR